MSEFIIYHNPRCSKSRKSLALLQEQGIEPRIIHYLTEPPDPETLRALLLKLAIGAAALVRAQEPAYAEAGLTADSTEAELIAAMARHPELIERPIIVRGSRAVLGRPPENLFELL